jgi:predicted DNA binding CopG/RHH family protein
MTKLTPEEKDILESYNNDEWVSVATPARMAELKSYAKETLTQDKKITLLLSSLDLEALQAKAIEEGIPYQTSNSHFEINRALTPILAGKI